MGEMPHLEEHIRSTKTAALGPTNKQKQIRILVV